jgi:hypothetical protein
MFSRPPAGTVTADLGAGERWAEAWCRELEPDTWHGSDAASAAERLAVVIRRLEAAQLRLAHRAEQCTAHSSKDRTAPGWFARLNGSTVAEARRALELAGRLEQCPTAAQALIDGELSVEKTAAVTEAAVLDPGTERRLVDKAKRSDLFETRAAADKIKHASRSTEDDAARHARLRQGRTWRVGKSPDGHTEVKAWFVPAEYAHIKPVLDAFMKTRLADAHDRGERDGYDAYAADAALAAIRAAGQHLGLTARPALGATGAAAPAPTATATATEDADQTHTTPTSSTDECGATGSSGSTATSTTVTATGATAAGSTGSVATSSTREGGATGSGATGSTAATADRPFDTPAVELVDGLDPKIDWSVVILVDGIALKRGYAAPGETCEIPGVGTIPVSWIHQLLPTAHAEMLIHDSVDIQAYATATRHRTRPVDLGVRVRDRDCNAGPCHHPVAEIDHRVPFADTHDTSMTNLGGFCARDHRDKTHHGGHLERHDTDWHWWPPGTDPTVDPPQTKPIGRHLTAWNLDHLPGATDEPRPSDDQPTLGFR